MILEGKFMYHFSSYFQRSPKGLTAKGLEEAAENQVSHALTMSNGDYKPKEHMHEQAKLALWSALSVGQHKAAVELARYYWDNSQIVTEEKIFSTILLKIYSKFANNEPANPLTHEQLYTYNYLNMQQVYLQQMLTVTQKLVIEVYTNKGYEILQNVKRQNYDSTLYTAQEVYQKIEYLKGNLIVQKVLYDRINHLVINNHNLDFITLTKEAINIEKNLHLREYKQQFLKPLEASANEDIGNILIQQLGGEVQDCENVV